MKEGQIKMGNKSIGVILVILIGIFIFPGGCISYRDLGKPIDEGLVSKIQEGKTTEADVLAMFGEPSSKQSMKGSIGDILMYMYIYTPKSGNGAKGKNVPQSLMIQFDNDKIVTLVTYSGEGKSDLSKGKPINKELVARIKEGKTTEADVLAMFGEPSSKKIIKRSAGDILMYMYTPKSGNGAKGENVPQSLMIQFDNDKIVTQFTYSEEGQTDLSKGKPINKELVSQIKEGKTTEADVLALFGEPQNKQSMKGSTGDTLMYMYMYRPKSGNEAKGKNVPQMLMIQFDNDKIVTLVTYSEQGKSDLSKGKPINKELVARIKEGKTTEADILVMFGEPQMKQSMKGSIGDNLMYVYQYMPNIGIGKGTEGMNGRQMLRISFDTDNIVTTFNYVGP